ncbi:MAG TPA: MarR family transcriptional regulator [Candidatus Didemnitutus sp.]|nr:MarR family transcriptional regulator [Candidatus Didemnitutus sp.]
MSSPERHLGFLLADINRLARKEFDRRVRPLGLTRAQWMFLYYLGRRPGATQSELAEELQLEKITISRQAERLERAGWIRRREDRHDGRAYRLRLTARAARTVNRLARLADRLRLDYLRGVPPSRRGALVDDLSRIKANLLEMEGVPAR